MGTYYRYVNNTRREFVSLSGLRAGGDKENAVLYCAPALAWLLLWPHACGDSYRGRWHARPADDVQVVSDGEFDFTDMVDAEYIDITPGLLQSMRTQVPGFVADYQPRRHDVSLNVYSVTNGLYVLLDQVGATCSCGWKCGPLFGDGRERTLTLIVSNHVNEVD